MSSLGHSRLQSPVPLTRRDLFGHMATGLGAAALGTLLAEDCRAADNATGTIDFSIVTPTRRVAGPIKVLSIIAPSVNGEITILPGHARLLA